MSNEQIVSMLEKMEKIMFMDGEPFKAEHIVKQRNCNAGEKPITSKKDVEGKNGFIKVGVLSKL